MKIVFKIILLIKLILLTNEELCPYHEIDSIIICNKNYGEICDKKYNFCEVKLKYDIEIGCCVFSEGYYYNINNKECLISTKVDYGKNYDNGEFICISNMKCKNRIYVSTKGYIYNVVNSNCEKKVVNYEENCDDNNICLANQFCFNGKYVRLMNLIIAKKV